MFKVIKDIFRSNNFKAELLYSLIKNLSYILIMALILVTYINIRIVPVNSGSMYPTFKKGDYLLQIKQSKNIKRFDIVSAKVKLESDPFNGKTIALEKRIIGLPGDEIKIENGIVFINDNELSGDYGFLSNTQSHVEGRDMPPIIVPPGHFFIMGDNRDHSLDSRNFGCIVEDDILYKIKHIFKITDYKLNKEYF